MQNMHSMPWRGDCVLKSNRECSCVVFRGSKNVIHKAGMNGNSAFFIQCFSCSSFGNIVTFLFGLHDYETWELFPLRSSSFTNSQRNIGSHHATTTWMFWLWNIITRDQFESCKLYHRLANSYNLSIYLYSLSAKSQPKNLGLSN